MLLKWYSKIFECKIAIIFFSINVNMCFGCSKEPSHRDGSFEYPQHMFWLRNKKNNFLLCTLILGPGYIYYFMILKLCIWSNVNVPYRLVLFASLP